MIRINQKGDFSKLTSFLEKGKEKVNLGVMNRYGRIGVDLLANATPVDSGLTANSWSYSITQRRGSVVLAFHNSNVAPGYAYGEEGVPIAILIQYGHATRNGGWVQGRDYINPALQPLFEKMAKDLWKEVSG